MVNWTVNKPPTIIDVKNPSSVKADHSAIIEINAFDPEDSEAKQNFPKQTMAFSSYPRLFVIVIAIAAALILLILVQYHKTAKK